MAKKEKDIKNKKQKSHYFKDMKAELKKVIWPTPKQLLNNTLAVIAFTVIIAVIVFILDLCFDSINKYGITVLQEKIQSSYQASHEEENTDETSETTNGEESNSDSENVVVEEEVVNEESVETENNSENAENVESVENEE